MSKAEGLRRSERKRARTRTELITAARTIFAARGYHETAISEITEQADVGVGTFYLHFRDKDDLFETLLDEGFRALREIIEAEMQSSRGPLLPGLIRVILRQLYLQRDLFQIALTAPGYGARKRRAVDDLAEYVLKALKTVRKGGLSGYELPIVSRLIAGMVTQCISLWCEDEALDLEIMTRQVLLLLQHGLPEHFFGEVEVQDQEPSV